MSFFENTRKPQGFGGKIMAAMQAAGFSDAQVDKNEKGWICVTARK